VSASEDRTMYTVPCPVGEARREPHSAVYDFELRALSCESCGFSGSGRTAAAIFSVCDRVVALEQLLEEVERVDPGRVREARRRTERATCAAS